MFYRPELKFDPSQFVTEQVFYPSKDGTRIPMFLCYRRGLQPNRDTPAYLYGYGGFNISETPVFSATMFQWFDAGGVMALALLTARSFIPVGTYPAFVDHLLKKQNGIPYGVAIMIGALMAIPSLPYLSSPLTLP